MTPFHRRLSSQPDTVIAMNKASLDKFDTADEKRRPADNEQLARSTRQPKLDDSIEIVKIPVDEIAVELGSAKVANMVALGAYLQKRGLFRPEVAADCLPDVLAERYHVTIPLNKKALQKGAQFICSHCGTASRHGK